MVGDPLQEKKKYTGSLSRGLVVNPRPHEHIVNHTCMHPTTTTARIVSCGIKTI